MGAKKPKKSGSESDTSSSTTGPDPPKVPNILFFLFLGIAIILGFAVLHILFSGLICFVLGFDTLTVVYVTAASVTTGAVITMALALLISLYCILTFFASLHNVAASSSERQKPTIASSLEDLMSTAAATATHASGDVKND